MRNLVLPGRAHIPIYPMNLLPPAIFPLAKLLFKVANRPPDWRTSSAAVYCEGWATGWYCTLIVVITTAEHNVALITRTKETCLSHTNFPPLRHQDLGPGIRMREWSRYRFRHEHARIRRTASAQGLPSRPVPGFCLAVLWNGWRCRSCAGIRKRLVGWFVGCTEHRVWGLRCETVKDDGVYSSSVVSDGCCSCGLAEGGFIGALVEI